MSTFLDYILIGAIVLTYIPQYFRIINRKNSLGLDPYFLLLSLSSVIAQLVNIVILQIDVIEDCLNDKTKCLPDALGFIQILVLTMCILVNTFLFLYYYPWTGTEEGNENGNEQQETFSERNDQVKICCFYFWTFIFISSIIVMGAARGDIHSDKSRFIGQSFGVACTIMSFVQYLPQLWTTWQTQYVGALSALMLAIQSPGSYYFAYTISQKKGTDISAWSSFFISATFQLVLCTMCIIVNKRNNRVVDRERQPLLAA